MFIVQDNKTLEYTCAPAPSDCEDYWLCNMLNKEHGNKVLSSQAWWNVPIITDDKILAKDLLLCSHSFHLHLNPICSQLTCLFLGNVHPPQFLSTDYHPTLVISILDYHSLLPV